MKTLLPLIAVAAAGLLTLHSQTPAAAPNPEMDETLVLQALKTDNAALIERQKKTLEQLDELLETARQLKIYTKRG